MNKENDLQAALIAHNLTADLWYELPGGDNQKHYWKDQFLGLIILFDCEVRANNLMGYQLVRRAWRTAFRYYDNNLKNDAHDFADRVLCAGLIAKRLVQMTRRDGQTILRHSAWHNALTTAVSDCNLYQGRIDRDYCE